MTKLRLFLLPLFLLLFQAALAQDSLELSDTPPVAIVALNQGVAQFYLSDSLIEGHDGHRRRVGEFKTVLGQSRLKQKEK